MPKKLYVKVEVYDLETQRVERSRTIDQYNANDREWLAKTAWWAMHNSKGVQTYAVRDTHLARRMPCVG